MSIVPQRDQTITIVTPITQASQLVPQTQPNTSNPEEEENAIISCSQSENSAGHGQPRTASIVDDDDEHLESSASNASAAKSTQFGSVDLVSVWIPAANPQRQTWRTRTSQRSVVIWSSMLALLAVSAINLTFSVLGWTKYNLSSDGVATLYEGDCTVSKRLNTGLHVIINVLSTITLSISNLSLQLMVSPTRDEVDAAHKKGRWLDIGVPSVQNLSNLPGSTMAFAGLLAFSSLPIHFLYNASVFSTISTNAYLYATVTEAFLQPDSTNLTFTLSNGTTFPAPRGINGSLYYTIPLAMIDSAPPYGASSEVSEEFRTTLRSIHQDVHVNLPAYQRLSNFDCIKNYYNPYGFRSNVLLVSTDYDTALEKQTSLLMWGWMLTDSDNIGNLSPLNWSRNPTARQHLIASLDKSEVESWNSSSGSLHVQYCLQVPDAVAAANFAACRVQCAPSILLVTAIFNICKCVCVAWLLYGRSQHTICTLGDAIASFLEHPDPVTKKCGIATAISVRKTHKHLKGVPQLWKPKDTRWYHAASRRRWYPAMLWSTVFLILGIAVVGHGISIVKYYYLDISWSKLWALGFGATSVEELIDWKQKKTGRLGLFTNIVMANIWQVGLSLCYLFQNALFSTEIVADEWTRFARERKSLRVSHPVGIQRSTYFISMPLRYGIPFMALFALEHWLLSQTTFIVRVTSFDIARTPASSGTSYTTTGYSTCPAIFAAILMLFIILINLAVAFLRKYPARSAMPLAATCSLAISANCHRPEADTDAHLLPVQWGVVDKDVQGVQRCSFTTLKAVHPPAIGSTVLGLPDGGASPARLE